MKGKGQNIWLFMHLETVAVIYIKEQQGKDEDQMTRWIPRWVLFALGMDTRRKER